MRIEVQVKPGAKKEEVVSLDARSFKVSVKERAVEGRANEAVRDALAEHFKVSKSRVQIAGGLKSKIKLFDILV